jgi:hypothetical protein
MAASPAAPAKVGNAASFGRRLQPATSKPSPASAMAQAPPSAPSPSTPTRRALASGGIVP